MTQDTIRKITGRAVLEFNENPSFVSFKQLSVAAANSSVDRLISAGYSASRVDNYIKILKPV